VVASPVGRTGRAVPRATWVTRARSLRRREPVSGSGNGRRRPPEGPLTTLLPIRKPNRRRLAGPPARVSLSPDPAGSGAGLVGAGVVRLHRPGARPSVPLQAGGPRSTLKTQPPTRRSNRHERRSPEGAHRPPHLRRGDRRRVAAEEAGGDPARGPHPDARSGLRGR